MKIKLNTTLKGIDGILVLDDPDFPGKKLTLKSKIMTSLLASRPDESDKEKLERYDIFKKVRDAPAEIDLKAEEIVIIKKAIGRIQPPLILGQCFELLDK